MASESMLSGEQEAAPLFVPNSSKKGLGIFVTDVNVDSRCYRGAAKRFAAIAWMTRHERR
jgi:hypothetical protein